MAKRNQILRVPQKKYTEDTFDDLTTNGLPHEQLIPAQTSAKTSSRTKAGDTGDTSHTGITSKGAISSSGKKETHLNNHLSKNDKAKSTRLKMNRSAKPDAGVTGITGIPGDTNTGVETGVELKGRARDVWSCFCRMANQQEANNNRVRVSRRQIQKESGIGSLNTVDAAIAMLQGRGWLRVHPLPGSNEGYEYEVLHEHSRRAQSSTPKAVAELLRRAAHTLEETSRSLSPEQMNKWSKIAFQAQRLIEEFGDNK